MRRPQITRDTLEKIVLRYVRGKHASTVVQAVEIGVKRGSNSPSHFALVIPDGSSENLEEIGMTATECIRCLYRFYDVIDEKLN
ncbi:MULTISPECIES: hypothetical protein [unclassified Methylobacterium]|uniref:hypothetical protein n=1 Tax=unclassified Methylobacterium TaxID=2615210 RepID=UPI0012376121|nr:MULTISPECIES: hypothetical protein [Methylobacterium]WFT77712.1 hypothetical protein QA634_20640 [Methylobacterium nodulans]